MTDDSPVRLEPDARARHYFEDMPVGTRFITARRTVTEADVVGFAGVSGDFNALHVDEVFASEGPFGRRVAHGLLVLSMATGLRQQSGVFQGVIRAFAEIKSWQFKRPVFIGDTICCVTTIITATPSSKPTHGVVEQQVDVVNQNGETVQSGVFVTLVSTRPAP